MQKGEYLQIIQENIRSSAQKIGSWVQLGVPAWQWSQTFIKNNEGNGSIILELRFCPGLNPTENMWPVMTNLISWGSVSAAWNSPLFIDSSYEINVKQLH